MAADTDWNNVGSISVRRQVSRVQRDGCLESDYELAARRLVSVLYKL